MKDCWCLNLSIPLTRLHAWVATLDIHCRYQLPTSPLRRPFVWQRELLRGIGQGAEDRDGQKGEGGITFIQVKRIHYWVERIGFYFNIQIGKFTFFFQALEAKKKLGESAKSQNAAHRKSKWDIQGVGDLTTASMLVRSLDVNWNFSEVTNHWIIFTDVTSHGWHRHSWNSDLGFWKSEQEEIGHIRLS